MTMVMRPAQEMLLKSRERWIVGLQLSDISAKSGLHLMFAVTMIPLIDHLSTFPRYYQHYFCKIIPGLIIILAFSGNNPSPQRVDFDFEIIGSGYPI